MNRQARRPNAAERRHVVDVSPTLGKQDGGGSLSQPRWQGWSHD
jgi:hypothetical protein